MLEPLADPLIDWSSPGNYIPVFVVIGIVLFGLLVANFIWIFLKYSKKENGGYGWNKGRRSNRLIRQFVKDT